MEELIKEIKLLREILHKIISKDIYILEMKMLIEIQQACDNKGVLMCEGEEIKTLTLKYKEIKK